MKYIVAVSGGVDSAVLLHVLARHSPLELVVAHFDHGIRDDSDSDVWHVASLAKIYDLPFVMARQCLGEGTSEEIARNARYAWLETVRQQYGADGIATAHHEDDLVETACLNLHRGTGWRGIASLQNTARLYRPLLQTSKAQIVQYALDNRLHWREDTTNDDMRYTRNRIRHQVIPRLSSQQRQRMVSLAHQQREVRQAIEKEAAQVLKVLKDTEGYRRYELVMMPEVVVLELLRQITHSACEPAQLRRLLHFVKTGRSGSVMQVGNGTTARLTATHVVL